MGNRRTDPYSSDLTPICESSPDWPKFTRVLPILNWSYANVWEFLKTFHLDYCILYDYGFTSLGEIHNTCKNPYLKIGQDESGEDKYLPASELQDEAFERASRIKSL
mmetsp:Transcript_43067/g.31443  ORF Transcript_43067/g.31443 Transcript_43067/m.31443 type:complete len:107 (+) Transcript_43067:370-690(+)